MKKRIFALIMIVAVLFSTMAFAADASSVYNRQKKSIYLVLDDSGSMEGQLAFDANYSLQTLIAMTDKSDSVHLYFLNDNSNLSGELQMSGKSNQMLADIRERYPESNGETPYDSVLVAEQELKDAVIKGDDTEYWLVVLTDGDFRGVDPSEKMNAFADETLANGKHPNVMFISIGGLVEIDTKGKPNLHSIKGNNIIAAMNEAARIISGRFEVKDPVYSSNNDTITFSTPYSTKNIVILTQENKTQIINSQSVSELDVSENYTVSNPGKSDKSSESSVCFITGKNGSVILPGEISFTFDKSLDPEDTIIFCEPAIGLVAHYYNQDGQEVDPSELKVYEKVRLTFNVCDSETGQALEKSVFDDDLTYYAEIDGKEYFDVNDIEFEVTSDSIDIRLLATLPDEYVLESHNKYENLEFLRNVTFSLSNGGYFKADYDNIDNEEGIVANILINGEKPTAEQFKNFDVKVQNKNLLSSNFSVEKDEASANFVIHPKKGIIGVFTPEKKTYEVMLVDSLGENLSAELTVEIPGERPWLQLILWFIGLALIVYLIIVFATKKYFPRGTVFLYYADDIPTEHEFHTATDKISLSKAMFTELVKSPKTFFKHLALQLLPNQPVKVNLYKIADGQFSCVTLNACNKFMIKVEDKSLRMQPDGSFEADFDLYDADFLTRMDFNDLVVLNEKKLEATLRIRQVLAKTIDIGNYQSFTHYVQVTTKKNLKKSNNYGNI